MAVRSDARRNRERLLHAAAAAFTANGASASLESIARDAGVGIGTLYRHFPNREALVEAVYQAELAEVAAAAGQLLKRHPPKIALRRWMDRYASFVAAKRGMAESLQAIFASGAIAPARLATASSAPSSCCYKPVRKTRRCAPMCRPTTWCPA